MSFIQVASWNIEHLSGQPRADRRQSAFALADHIEMAGIDVIALQEVYVTDPDEQVSLSSTPGAPAVPIAAYEGSPRNSDLDMVCAILKEHLDGDPDWHYVILPNRVAGDTSQLCAVMWNGARLTLKDGTPMALPVAHASGDMKLWDRKPHLVSFVSSVRVWRRDDAGKWQQQEETRTLSVVPLHMKSNFKGATLNRKVRAAEAETLCEVLASAAAGKDWDPSVMLLGDTNILANDEPAIETFIANGWIDLNNNDQSTYWSPQYSNGSPFDRIFLAPGRPEFKYSRQYILRSSDLEAHDRFLSDHYMIKVSVKDYVDDADQRPTP